MEDDSNESPRPPTWREEHAATIMGLVLASLLALIIIVQSC
jgi:hypothetical protein